MSSLIDPSNKTLPREDAVTLAGLSCLPDPLTGNPSRQYIAHHNPSNRSHPGEYAPACLRLNDSRCQCDITDTTPKTRHSKLSHEIQIPTVLLLSRS